MKSFMSYFERTKKADHIFEIAGPGLFCDYRLIQLIILVKLD